MMPDTDNQEIQLLTYFRSTENLSQKYLECLNLVLGIIPRPFFWVREK